ncbi:MAG: helicase-exonuclease AddAB subunit AddA [Clostridia bacterium]
MEFTKSQQEAIDKKGGMVLVSAAAGSGKTAVLTERVLQFVLSGNDLERLLIVTFTKKAAAQMRDRISTVVNTALSKSPHNIHLLKQSMKVHKAKICTIDSYFAEIVRNNFYNLSISSNFKAADDIEIMLLREQIATDIVIDAYKTIPNFADVCDLLSTDKTDQNVINIILKLYKLLESIPFEDDWLNFALSQFDADNNGFATKSFLINELKLNLIEIKQMYSDKMAEMDFDEMVTAAFGPFLTNEINIMNVLIEKCTLGNFADIKAFIDTINLDGTPSAKGINTNPLKKMGTALRKHFKDFITSLKNNAFFISEQDNIDDCNYLRPIITTIITLVKQFEIQYTEALNRKNILYFSDITKLALKLLVKGISENNTPIETELAKTIKSLYDEVLIDEYQDTNEIQDLIFSVISDNGKNLFVVGDIRQSIYGFRGGRPEIFMQKQELAKQSPDDFPHLVNLAENFRSRGEVIDFINFFFSHCMTKNVGNVDYINDGALIASAPYPKDESKITEITIINSAEDDAYDPDAVIEKDVLKYSKYDIEAKYVADKIAEMLKSGYEIFDIKNNCYRKATPSDFAVLLRKKRGTLVAFSNAFQNANVPVFCENNNNYFEQYEIESIISIIKTIDNPYDDIALAATLRCPAFGFTNDELVDIRLAGNKLCFYDAFKKISEENEKFKNVLDKLSFLRLRSRELPIYRFLMLLINDLSLMRVFGGMNNGATRQENLNQLCRYAKSYEDSGSHGLYGFVNFIKKVIEKEGGISPASSIPANEFVSIMTIHQSKGLEFPIVFLCCLDSSFNSTDASQPFLIDKELGFGPRVRDMDMRIEFNTLAYEAISQKIKLKNLSEEMRVLYVACTRASDKLFITATAKDSEIKRAKSSITSRGTISESYLKSVNKMSFWLLSALMIHPDSASILDATRATNSWKTNSHIQLTLKDKNDIIAIKTTKETSEKKPFTEDTTLRAEIFNRLLFKYSKDALFSVPSKLTVSEIKSNLLDDNSEKLYDELSFIKPSFIAGKNSADIGTAIHKFLQYADNTRCKTKQELIATLKDAMENHVFSESIYKDINLSSLLSFFSSDLATRMNSSSQLYKEYRFTMMLPIAEYYKITKTPPYDFDETILLQGVIDCFFIENGKIILVDYKTDYAPDEDALVEKYKIQLDLYQKAIEKIFNLPVTEKIIYSFYKNKSIYLD